MSRRTSPVVISARFTTLCMTFSPVSPLYVHTRSDYGRCPFVHSHRKAIRIETPLQCHAKLLPAQYKNTKNTNYQQTTKHTRPQNWLNVPRLPTMNPYRLPPPPPRHQLDPRQWWVRSDPHLYHGLYHSHPGEHPYGQGPSLPPYRAPGPGGDWHYQRNGLPSIRNVNLGPYVFWR